MINNLKDWLLHCIDHRDSYLGITWTLIKPRHQPLGQPKNLAGLIFFISFEISGLMIKAVIGGAVIPSLMGIVYKGSGVSASFAMLLISDPSSWVLIT